jgi:hypothetical protein
MGKGFLSEKFDELFFLTRVAAVLGNDYVFLLFMASLYRENRPTKA